MQSRDIVIGILSILLIVLLIYTFLMSPETGEVPDAVDNTALQDQISQQAQEIEKLKQTIVQLEEQLSNTIKTKNETIAQLQQQVDQQIKLLEEKAKPEAILSLEQRIAALEEELKQKLQIQEALTKDTSTTKTPPSLETQETKPEAIVSLQKQIASLQEELKLTQQIQEALIKRDTSVTKAPSAPLEKQQIQEALTKKDTSVAETPQKKQEMEVIKRPDESVVIRFSDRVLFDTGKAHLKPSGKDLLKKVGAVLSQIKDLDIQVEGHTDSRPIGGVLQRKYATNWELSAARSTNVVRYLVENLGVDATHISAAGYGQYRPIADNDTSENLQLNRRVEFVLRPILPEKLEELPDLN